MTAQRPHTRTSRRGRRFEAGRGQALPKDYNRRRMREDLAKKMIQYDDTFVLWEHFSEWSIPALEREFDERFPGADKEGWVNHLIDDKMSSQTKIEATTSLLDLWDDEELYEYWEDFDNWH